MIVIEAIQLISAGVIQLKVDFVFTKENLSNEKYAVHLYDSLKLQNKSDIYVQYTPISVSEILAIF